MRTDSPAYYQVPGLCHSNGDPADLGDVVDAHGDLSHWSVGVITHVYRAGRKRGEGRLAALINARQCLQREIERVGMECLERAEDEEESRFGSGWMLDYVRGEEPWERPPGCSS